MALGYCSQGPNAVQFHTHAIDTRFVSSLRRRFGAE
jgi:hypothetical protein